MTWRSKVPVLAVVALSAAACVSVGLTNVSTFSTPAGHFSAVVPNGTMKEEQSPGAGHYQGSVVETFTNTQPDGTAFIVITAAATDGYPSEAQVEAGLDGMEAVNLRSTGGQLVAERHLTISGNPGREQDIRASTTSYIFRVTFVGTRSWLVVVQGTDVTAHQAMSQVFLDSFTVLP